MDKMGQLAPDIMRTTKPELLDQCDRILHNMADFGRIPENIFNKNKDTILKDISAILAVLRNTKGDKVDGKYLNYFNATLSRVIKIFSNNLNFKILHIAQVT